MTKPWDDSRIARGMKAQLAKRRERIKAGEPPIGWKVGMGGPAMMERLRITKPLIGFLMQRALVAPGSTVSFKGWLKRAEGDGSRPSSEPDLPNTRSSQKFARVRGSSGESRFKVI